ncbi:HvfA family oxazolone/thioamide-modified RiPP metallophore [Psychrobacter sp. I-STPA10]|uniref:HvfA family oxazolone/thioamide-modified RiPP metallophore n=1 Tax=Psychrobacter sp. I-STPA10 TaxID=2585769 RepID=UPI001E4A5E40|nr:hypothetical protein [Psychrobacter sp. I-STPA10]
MKKTSIITSLALGSLVAMGSAHAGESNPYSAKSMQDGYQNTTKAKEGKCGEGKCGGSAKKSSAKKADGKCGEGKCGGTVKKPVKKADGKCGEGKCGGSH